MPRDDKVAILKESLAAIGRRIEVVLASKKEIGEDIERWRRHLWTYVHCSIPTFLSCSHSQQFCDLVLAEKSQGRETRGDPFEDDDEGG